jgi:hypothetical protein
MSLYNVGASELLRTKIKPFNELTVKRVDLDERGTMLAVMGENSLRVRMRSVEESTERIASPNFAGGAVA